MGKKGHLHRNIIKDSSINSDGNIHIGDVNVNNFTLEPKEPQKSPNQTTLSILIVILGILIGFLGELMPDNLKVKIAAFVSAKLGVSYMIFWIYATIFFVLLFLFLTWKDQIGRHNEKAIDTKLVIEIRNWLAKRYSVRLEQKTAGRLPINLRRIDFTEKAQSVSRKKFKEIPSDEIGIELSRFFNTAENRLLIVGSPGAGKTTLLLQLAIDMLRTEDDALPVVLNLVTWSSRHETIHDWLIEILPFEFGVSKKLVNSLLLNSRIIFLFDGLDEIEDATERGKCMNAIDIFVSTVSPIRKFVISSRMNEFFETQYMPMVSFPIEIGSLTIKQIENQLSLRNPAQPEDRDLLAAIRNDNLLQKVAETPFYFNCLQLIFAENIRINFYSKTSKDRESEILEIFIKNELAKCSNSNTQKWLSYLAMQMNHNNISSFELIHIQDNWCVFSSFSNVIYSIINIFVYLLPKLVLPFAFIVAGVFYESLKVWSLMMFGSISILFFMIFAYANKYIRKVETKEYIPQNVIYYIKNYLTISSLVPIFIILKGGFNKDAIQFAIIFELMVFGIGALDLNSKGKSGQSQLRYPYARFVNSIFYIHLSILQHAFLRYKIYINGNLPLHLVSFLNEMSNSPNNRTRRFTIRPVNLIESDGTSWRFRHRLIQEWFSSQFND